MMRLFEHTDGSLEWGIDTFVRRWLWDDQGKTDTITSSYSLDDWNQILAIGAKLGCGSQFLQTPPSSSAQEFLGEFFKNDLPEKRVDLEHIAHHAFWGLHALPNHPDAKLLARERWRGPVHRHRLAAPRRHPAMAEAQVRCNTQHQPLKLPERYREVLERVRPPSQPTKSPKSYRKILGNVTTDKPCTFEESIYARRWRKE
jgi:hypothetical protein